MKLTTLFLVLMTTTRVRAAGNEYVQSVSNDEIENDADYYGFDYYENQRDDYDVGVDYGAADATDNVDREEDDYVEYFENRHNLSSCTGDASCPDGMYCPQFHGACIKKPTESVFVGSHILIPKEAKNEDLSSKHYCQTLQTCLRLRSECGDPIQCFGLGKLGSRCTQQADCRSSSSFCDVDGATRRRGRCHRRRKEGRRCNGGGELMCRRGTLCGITPELREHAKSAKDSKKLRHCYKPHGGHLDDCSVAHPCLESLFCDKTRNTQYRGWVCRTKAEIDSDVSYVVAVGGGMFAEEDIPGWTENEHHV